MRKFAILASLAIASVAFAMPASASCKKCSNNNVTLKNTLEVDAQSFGNALTGTFSKGYVSTHSGLNTPNIAAVGVTDAYAVGEGVATIGGKATQGSSKVLRSDLKGYVGGSAAAGVDSYSGSMVNGTGFAKNLTGGFSYASGSGSISTSVSK